MGQNKVDILAIGVHPDDIELGCGGTIITSIKEGKKVALLDLTAGELGTRGTDKTRAEEAAAAAKILGVVHRENLYMEDGFFEITEANILKVIVAIRKYQPEIILCNAPTDRHPDHGRASQLVVRAAFLSGLRKIETASCSENQQAWRPKYVFHYIQDTYLEPDFVFDISSSVDQKMESVRAYKTQFDSPSTDEPQTYISTPDFLERTLGRSLSLGKTIGVLHAEGFLTSKKIGIESFDAFIQHTT